MSFEDRMAQEIIALSNNMKSFLQLEKYSIYRPKCTVAEDAKAWWM